LPRTSLPDIKQLVRAQLGCACPDQVFDSIDLLGAAAGFAGMPGDYLIAVSDRLLLLVVSSARWQEVLDQLDVLLIRGRQLRDAEGFNRFRLVVGVTERAAAQAALAERFAALPDLDDRVHLHVVSAETLAELGFVATGNDT
jgi:hypothetical protein